MSTKSSPTNGLPLKPHNPNDGLFHPDLNPFKQIHDHSCTVVRIGESVESVTVQTSASKLITHIFRTKDCWVLMIGYNRFELRDDGGVWAVQDSVCVERGIIEPAKDKDKKES